MRSDEESDPKYGQKGISLGQRRSLAGQNWARIRGIRKKYKRRKAGRVY